MPQIGWFEILLIISLAVIIVGPKDFPIMLRKVGSWIGTAKRYFNTIQEEISVYQDENFEDTNVKKENDNLDKNEKK